MDGRGFSRRSLLAAAGALPVVYAVSFAQGAQKNFGQIEERGWDDVEHAVRGRLGVAVLDTGTGTLVGHRLDERFPMCSSFKFLAAALVLARVDAGAERLERRVPIRREDLLDYAPVSAGHVGDTLSVAQLCEAAVAVSDNTAANLLLADVGGPAALTRFLRGLGDAQTRLDRNEPTLNEAVPGDPRDTTTPRAMAHALRATTLGDALAPASRAQLVAWMTATSTGAKRLRAGLPTDWRVGDKTGTGRLGTTNDVAVAWPPRRPPLLIAAYLTECSAPIEAREAALAEVARRVAAMSWGRAV